MKTASACRDSHSLYNKLPYKFEAGTPDVAGAIGLGAAIEYVNGVGMDNIAAQEHELLADATEAVSAIPGIRLIGALREKRLAYSRSCWTASTRTTLKHPTHEIRDGCGRRAIDPASSTTEPRNAATLRDFYRLQAADLQAADRICAHHRRICLPLPSRL